MRTIEARRVTLEPQTAAHADEMFVVLSDPAIYTYENEPPASLEWLRTRFAKLESRRSADGSEQWLNWVVRLRDSELIGYVQATVLPDRRALIAYEFASRHWGRGLAREATEALIRELVEYYQVISLRAVAKTANARSLRLLERLGFAPAGPDAIAASQVESGEVLLTRAASIASPGPVSPQPFRAGLRLPHLDLEIRPASREQRQPLQRMLEFYQYELSEIWDQDLDPQGEFGYALDRYWRDSACFPYIVVVRGNYAGFALVDGQVVIPGDDFWMDQFFIMKKYRKQGVGRAVATSVFDRHAGRWQVGQMAANTPAQAFWRKTIGAYTSGNYEELRLTSHWWQGVVQRFVSTGAPDHRHMARSDER